MKTKSLKRVLTSTRITLLFFLLFAALAKAQPPTPVLHYPLNNATNVQVQHDVAINDMTGISTIEYEYDTSPNFLSSDPDYYTNSVASGNWTSNTNYNGVNSDYFSKSSIGIKFGKTYYLRVRVYDAADNVSAWSNVRTFTIINAPNLHFPSNNAAEIQVSHTVAINDMTGISKIEYEYDTNPAFSNSDPDYYTNNVTSGNWTSNTIYNSVNSDFFTKSSNGIKFGKKYYLRVRVYNDDNSPSAWSNVNSFITVDVPHLNEPMNNATDVQVQHTVAINDMTGISKIEYEYDTDQGFSNSDPDYYTNSVASGNWTSNTNYNGINSDFFTKSSNGIKFGKKYYLRVRVYNDDNFPSAWSNVNSLTTIDAPFLHAPSNNASDVQVSHTVAINDMNGISKIEYEYDTNPAFSNSDPDYYTNNVTSGNWTSNTNYNGINSDFFTSSNGVKFGRTYYVRVRVYNADNLSSAWSNVNTFTTIAAPKLTAPADGATNVSTAGTTLSWNDISGKADFQIQVSTDNLYSSLLFKATQTGTSKATGALAANTTYFWRVRARVTINAVDYFSAWSERSFSTGPSVATLPATPTLTSPANNSTNQDLSPILSWSEITGATYKYEYSTDQNFIYNVQSGNIAAGTTNLQLNSLNELTTYYWRVRSVDGGLASAWSNAFSFTTGKAKIPVTVSISNNQLTYSGTAKAVTVTTTPAGVANSITYKQGGIIITNPTNAGNYDVEIAITDVNYVLNGSGTGTLTIGKAALNITANNNQKVYGDSNPSLTFTYTGFVNGEKEGVLDVAPSISTTATQFSDAGSYDIVPSGGSDDNYSFNFHNGTLTINKATLQVTADPASKTYGQVNPTLTYKYSGFVGTDDANSIDTPPTISTTATQFSDVAQYDITPAGGSDNNYTFTYTKAKLTISKASLQVKADAKSKNYGQPNPALTFQYTGFVGSDNAAVIDTPPTIATTATQFSDVAQYNITLSGGSDNNYTFTYTPAKLTINKATLQVSADAKFKSYGQNNPSLTFQYSGFAGTDNSSVIDTPPSISTTATQFSNAGDYDITLTGGSDNNYSFAFTNSKLTIGKATLQVTADAASKKYGEANPALTFQYSGFVGTDDKSSLMDPPTVSTTAGQFSDAGLYDITPSGGNDNNYSFAFTSAKLTITKASLQVIADAKSKTYGQPNPTLTYQYSGFVGTDNSSVIDTPPSITTTATQFSNVAQYNITLSGGSDNNYSFTFTSAKLTISKASLQVIADAKSKTYGQNNPALTFQYSGFVGTDNASVINTQPSITTTATQFSNVGLYDITLSGGSDNNYSLSLTNSKLTVEKAMLQVTADAKSKTYGQNNPALTFQYSGFAGSENSSVIDTPPSISTTATQFSNAGDYDITLSGGSDNNYSFAFNTAKLTITKATLQVTADAKSKIYGQNNPTLTFQYSGFVGSENSSVVDTPPSISTTATQFSNVAQYDITPSGGSDNNYSFAFTSAKLTITKASLQVAADAKSRSYGQLNPTLTFQYSGFVGTDNSSVIDTPPAISTTATQFSNVGQYDITLTGGNDNNYSLTFTSNKLTVTKAVLLVTADAKSKTYGQNNPTLTFKYSGFAGTETQSVIDTPPSIATTALKYSDTGSYDITLSGGSDNNYSFNFTSGTLTISKAPLTAKADSKSRTYGQENPTLTFSYQGLLGTDSPSDIDTPPTVSTTATTSSDVADYPITLSGGMDNNYTITLTNGTLTIIKADQQITFNPLQTKDVNDPQFELTATSTSQLPVTYESSNPAVATVSGNTVTIHAIGNTLITASQAGNNNYHAAMQVAQSLVITTKLAQAITFSAITDKTVGGSPFVISATSDSGLPVSFVTSSSNISINGNEVTILGAGHATITAQQSGDNAYKSADDVSVTFCVNPVKPGLTIEGEGTSSPTLHSNAADNTWYRNNVLMSGENGTTLTVTQPGQYSAKSSVDGCVSDPSEAFTIIITELEDDLSKSISIYPNPTTEKIVIDTQLQTNAVKQIRILDFNGKTVGTTESTNSRIEIPVSNYAPGMYLIQIQYKSQNLVSKFVKQ